MKKLYILLGLLISSLTFAQVPLLIEDFDYTAGEALTDHGWTGHSGGTTNPQLVTSPGLTFAGYVGSDVGLAAGVNNTGQDVNKPFTPVTSGSVYTSFMLNSESMVKGGYFFHYRDEAASTAFRARTFVVPVTGKMMVGFSFNASAYQDSLATLLNFGETYLLVVKYTIVEGADNDMVSLYVFKSGDDFSTEPGTPTVGPLTATNTTPGDTTTPLGPDITPMQIALRQFDADQRITIDGIRVKTNWDLSQDEALNLSVSTNAISVSQAASSNSTFDITSNTSWKATLDQTWLTLSSDTGVGNANITVTVEANATLSSRTANITVTATDLSPEVITVTQDAAGTAVHTAKAGQLKVYPNPVTDGLLYISVSGNSLRQIEIFNATGKQVRARNTSDNTVDVSDLKAGLYFIKVKDNSQTSTSKFIIK